MEVCADFTAECNRSDVKVVYISATDFIRSFRNCIKSIKEIHSIKEKQHKGRIDLIKSNQGVGNVLTHSASELAETTIFDRKAEMASPTIKKKLTRMLSQRHREKLASNSSKMENMAENGNTMAKTVIGISNQLHL